MGWKIGKEKYRLENIQNSPKNLFIRILAICVSVSQGQKRRGKREQFIDPFLRYRKAVNMYPVLCRSLYESSAEINTDISPMYF